MVRTVGLPGRSLAMVGAETIRGDLGDPEPLRAAFSDAHYVFSVQPNSGQAVADVTTEDEVPFGTAVADIAERCGIAHLVHSSAVTADSATGVDHLDTKNRIEAHVRNLDIAAPVIRPTTFMEIAGDALTGRAWPSSHPGRGSADQLQPPACATLLAQDEVLGKLAALVDDGGPAGNVDLAVLRAEFPFLLRFDRQLPRPVTGLGEPTSSRVSPRSAMTTSAPPVSRAPNARSNGGRGDTRA